MDQCSIAPFTAKQCTGAISGERVRVQVRIFWRAMSERACEFPELLSSVEGAQARSEGPVETDQCSIAPFTAKQCTGAIYGERVQVRIFWRAISE